MGGTDCLHKDSAICCEFCVDTLYSYDNVRVSHWEKAWLLVTGSVVLHHVKVNWNLSFVRRIR